MNMNMFIKKIILSLFIFQFPVISASRYGAFCNSDSDCDQYQTCLNKLCLCNLNERRFWTGTMCAICAKEYIVTRDRCYKYFYELKTWEASRIHCRAQYADLVTWRDNHDEQFIRPLIQSWVSTPLFVQTWYLMLKPKPNQPYVIWAGAKITSLKPYTIQWMDPDGMKLDLTSTEWCDPTDHSGYSLQKEPTSETRQGPNGTEREECVTYNFGLPGSNFLCLSNDYCSQKYPFICEMNAASMKLASSAHYDTNNVGISSGTDQGTSFETNGNTIDFEELPSPPTKDPNFTAENLGSAGALKEESGFLTTTNIIIIAIVGAVLIIGAIAGYIFIKNKKKSTLNPTGRNEGTTQSRPSFASSIGSMADE
ncbi:unnamed protein product [Rotaria sordida]|uniref:C-type lectin domain-containing protein n=2 Tax=Rotaria sordida TaxID=392033 RepID=A0A819CPC0_9BILA|nr:unnamed protein product [Rotaria sordida]